MTHSTDKLLDQKRIDRAAFRWNTASGMVMAFQSVVMLMVLTRVCDVQTAGVFTIAYANASLFLYIGRYGMRHFQVSDRNDQYSFADYRVSRVVTDVAMMVIGLAYILFASWSLSYDLEKTLVMVVMLVFKLVDCSEDVFMGNYQQRGRLDVGARVLTVRLSTAIALFAILAVVFASLLLPLVIATAYTLAFYILEVRYVRKRYGLPRNETPAGEGGDAASPAARKWSRAAVWGLLKACFPLFAASFLLFYIGSAPKYAIDAIMNDAAQAYYGYIAMPVFVVSLLASFVYNPMIVSLSEQWRQRKVRAFVLSFAKLTGVIVGITAVCVLAGWIAGVPVLDWLYNADTAPYLGDLLVLVAGGGFYALIALAVLGITIVRFQRVLVPLYAAASVAAFFVSNWAVASYGVDGASWAYVGCMGVLALVVIVCFAIGIRIMDRSARFDDR